MRIVCAMSGGVDSSMAAAVLVEAGHEVIGMTMRLYDAPPQERTGRGGTCCSPAEVDMAQLACASLGIPHYTVDERTRFSADVIDPFVRDYAAGRTPNPCTRCNQQVKFGPLLARAQALGASSLATGHYARIEDGALLRGADPAKDQSYFLFAMGKANLSRVMFPLGNWTKDDVRAAARTRGMLNADTPDSQELCFVPGGDHSAVVERRAAQLGLSAEALAPGPIVDEAGRTMGRHSGIHRMTVGQRRGFSVTGNERRYVLQVLPRSRTAVVGAAEDAVTRELRIDELHRLQLPEHGDVHAHVQYRHRATPQPAVVRLQGDQAWVRFDADVRVAAPGQAAVIYDGDRVLGGGWIGAVARTAL